MRNKIIVALLSFLAAIVLAIILNLTRDIFVPLIIAWFLAQISQPILSLGKRMRFPHIAKVLLVFAVIFVVFLLGINLFTSQVREAETVFAAYSPKLNDLVNMVFGTLQIPLESFSIIAILKRYLADISGQVINISTQFVLTLVFLMFMLLELPDWDGKLDAAFPGAGSTTIRSILGSISRQTSNYLGTLVIISFITGLCVWIFLYFMGVELAAFWGILAFILNFIPNIGSVIATIPPVLMALLQFSPSYGPAIVTLIVLGSIQMVTGNILGPKLLGDSLGLSPVVVMISLLLWGLILGIPGAILSVPIASIIKIICENIPALRPLAVIMGTKPPPSD